MFSLKLADQSCMKFLILIYSLFLLASCGADKMKYAPSTGSNALSAAQACGCNHLGPPVCGADGKDYDNSCIANCFGSSVAKTGHCNCATNNIKVCGSDGLDHTECEAIQDLSISIVKYIPCAAVEQ
jgi:hypothetical protein